MSNIRDVAKLANVSTATVSRVLNNDLKYKMTDETRQRVLDAVNELNYELTASSGKGAVSSGKGKVGCILRLTKKKFNDPYYMSILSAVENRLRERGYEIVFIKSANEIADRSQFFALFNEPVDGIILMDELDDDQFKYIKNQGISLVGIDTLRNDIDNIGYDRFSVALTATERLIKAGNSKIGFIGGGGKEHDIKTSHRFRGFQTAMYCAGIPINEKWVIDCEWDEDLCAAKLNELCRSNNLPTAFFVSSDLMAMAALSVFYTNGIKVPSEISIISVTDIEMAKFANPPLTTYRIPTDAIGYAAADLLVARIHGYDLIPEKIILPCELITRGSARL